MLILSVYLDECVFSVTIANILATTSNVIDMTAKKIAISAEIMCTYYISWRVSCHYYFFSVCEFHTNPVPWQSQESCEILQSLIWKFTGYLVYGNRMSQ